MNISQARTAGRLPAADDLVDAFENQYGTDGTDGTRRTGRTGLVGISKTQMFCLDESCADLDFSFSAREIEFAFICLG
jgi:hypothetical protein